MKEFVGRLIQERIDLNNKVEKLESFMNGSTFEGLSYLEQKYLKEQLEFMKKYLEVLEARIKLYEEVI